MGSGISGGLCGGLGTGAAIAQWNPPNPVVSFDKQANGLEIHQKDGVLRFEVDAPDVLHVTYSPLDASQPAHSSDHVVIKTDWPAASFDVSENDKAITLTTAKLKVAIERQSGSIHYQGADGKQLTTDTLSDAPSRRGERGADIPRGGCLRHLRVA